MFEAALILGFAVLCVWTWWDMAGRHDARLFEDDGQTYGDVVEFDALSRDVIEEDDDRPYATVTCIETGRPMCTVTNIEELRNRRAARQDGGLIA